jgi:hypothetical protein
MPSEACKTAFDFLANLEDLASEQRQAVHAALENTTSIDVATLPLADVDAEPAQLDLSIEGHHVDNEVGAPWTRHRK